MKKISGFGLVEVLVAAGLLGVLSLGVIKLMDNMQKGQKTVELAAHKSDVITMLKLYLSNPKSCQQTLQGLQSGDGEVTNVTKIIHGGTTPKTIVDMAANIGKEYGEGASKLEITAITLRDFEELTVPSATQAGEGTARLEFSFKKASKKPDGTYGAENFTQSIFLQVFVDTDYEVVACTDSEASAKAACEVLSGTLKIDGVTGELACSGVDILKDANAAITTDGKIEVVQANNNVGLALVNETTNSTIYLKPNEISLSNPANGTAMHVRTWGTSVDIESLNGPLVFNNVGVNQKRWIPDTADTDSDGDTTEIIEETVPIDGRVQIGGFNNTVTDTLWVKGTMYSTGNIRSDGSVTATAFIPSDIRLKDNIQPIEPAMKTLARLEGIEFEWNELSRRSGKTAGFKAQEVEKVYPHLVMKDESGMLAVNYNGLIPYLLEALKEQDQKIKKLEAALQMLKKEHE